MCRVVVSIYKLMSYNLYRITHPQEFMIMKTTNFPTNIVSNLKYIAVYYTVMPKKDKISTPPIEKVPIAEVKKSGQDTVGKSEFSDLKQKEKEDKFKKTLRVEK